MLLHWNSYSIHILIIRVMDKTLSLLLALLALDAGKKGVPVFRFAYFLPVVALKNRFMFFWVWLLLLLLLPKLAYMNNVEQDRDSFSRMQQGDKRAFEYFFKEYADMLYAYALGFSRDQDAAEDLVQEAFVRFWTMREKLSYSESIYGYLQRTVRNICINQKVRERVEEKYRRELLNTEEGEFDWEDDGALEGLRQQLLEAIDRLPEKCREIFVLSCVEGLKYKEVADQLGVSINTVKTQVRFGYKKLRTDLDIPEKNLMIILLVILLK